MVRMKLLILRLTKAREGHKSELIMTSAQFFIQTMLSRSLYCFPAYEQQLLPTGCFVCKENFSLNQTIL